MAEDFASGTQRTITLHPLLLCLRKIPPGGPSGHPSDIRKCENACPKRQNVVRPLGLSAGSTRFGQTRHIAGKRVNLEVHHIPDGHIAPCCHFFGVGDEVDAKHGPLHFVDSQ